MNIGERIGDYEITGILGAGGMGQVYQVRNLLSDRIEAIKVLLPNLESDPELAARFLREIKTQAGLDHPNIARLLTAQAAGNQLIMVMEYLEGSTLEKLIEQGPLGIQESVHYMMQVLDALAYAHERGVIHRDIKPANIMRTPNGTVKLMDFGIARVQQDSRLTKTGHTVGSLFYMSPEQIKGGQPDLRSDIYSLGITLYEMVTGRRPFQATSDFAIMAAHLQQVPQAPIEIIPGVPPALSDIVLMAIAKEPEHRFQTAAAFRSALGSLAGFSTAPQPVAYQQTVPYPQPPPMLTPLSIPPTVPIPLPPMLPVPRASSNRGLYMTLGSIATVAVLGAGLYFGPSFLKTGASSSPVPETAPEKALTPQTQAIPEKTAERPPASAAPENALAEPQGQSQGQSQGQPQAQPQVRPVPVQVQATPVVQAPPVAAQAPPAPAPVPVQNAPPAAPAPNRQPAARPAAPSPELAQLREDYNLMAVRVGTAKAELQAMEQRIRRQGFGLRADMIEAQSRLDYLMKESMDSIRAGDAEGARRTLDMAGGTVVKVERFLGR